MENQERINKFNTIKKRMGKDKKEFLEIFEESIGIVTTACQKKGIDRGTYYQWLKKDPKFRKEVERIKQEQVGIVEDKLVQAILSDNITAIIFYLKCRHPDYKPKSEFSFDKESIDKTLDKIKAFLE